jgi:hypothetical protein
LLAKYTLHSLPAASSDLLTLSNVIRDPPGLLLTREQRTQRAAELLWMALAIRLVDEGWSLHMQPGEFYLAHGESRIVPSEVIGRLRTGTTGASAWIDWCRSNNLGPVGLASNLVSAG